MSLSREVQGARRSRGESESMHTRREKSKSRITRKVGRIKGGVARRGRVFLNRGSIVSRVANQNMGRSIVEREDRTSKRVVGLEGG